MREARLRLEPTPVAAGLGRRFVERHLCRAALPADTIDAAVLVSSELVTNALRHGEGEIELRVRLGDRQVRLEVIDEGHRSAPSVRPRQPDETGGWGLRIVDQLAREWGVAEGTTHVWAELPAD